ncbi:MAG: formylglycine-generating enzyme family protein, partial [Anaerolineae bacterium]
DVDRALTQFYEETLAAALADPAAAGVSERQLRSWFDKELITEEGTRGLVHQGESDAGGLPNGVVRALQRRFLVRAEARGGDTWIELVHDRFVEPVRASNAAWFPQHLSALQRQAALWNEQGRSDGLLLSGKALAEAEAWAAALTELLELEAVEQEFLSACRRAQAVAERERSVTRRYSIVGVVMMVFFLLFISFSNLEDKANAALAEERAAVAEARLAQAGQSLGILDIEQILSMAGGLDEGGDARGATTLVQTAIILNPTLLDAGNLDTLSVKSLSLLKSYVPIGRNGYQYVFIPDGTFVMGSDDDTENEAPRNSVYLPGYWIGRTEVTNDQYAVFVEATGHSAPANWEGGEAPPGKGDHPVVNVSWDDAVAYTAWLSAETGQAFRLPTEAEWEKACEGANGFIYPWGFEFEANKANTAYESAGTTTSVGRYSSAGRDSPYGVADMAGNVSEWTSSQDMRYPYDANDGREDLMNHSRRVLRGGSFVNDASKVRCAVRTGRNPEDSFNDLGFRVAWASPGP